MLIYGGPASASSVVINYLDSLGITHIHLMVTTNIYEDYIIGLVAVLESTITVDEILCNNQTHTSATYTYFLNLAQGFIVTVAQRGQTFTLTETANLIVFNPFQHLEFTDYNDTVIVKLQVGSTSFLLTGDAEADAIKWEAKEECGLIIELIEDKPVNVFDNRVMDENKHLRYPYILLQFLSQSSGRFLKSAGDVTEAR